MPTIHNADNNDNWPPAVDNPSTTPNLFPMQDNSYSKTILLAHLSSFLSIWITNNNAAPADNANQNQCTLSTPTHLCENCATIPQPITVSMRSFLTTNCNSKNLMKNVNRCYNLGQTSIWHQQLCSTCHAKIKIWQPTFNSLKTPWHPDTATAPFDYKLCLMATNDKCNQMAQYWPWEWMPVPTPLLTPPCPKNTNMSLTPPILPFPKAMPLHFLNQ